MDNDYPAFGHAWCPTCRRRVQIEDQHQESSFQGGSGGAREYHYWVENLECGHTNQHDQGSTDTAPGGGSGTLPRAYDLGRAGL